MDAAAEIIARRKLHRPAARFGARGDGLVDCGAVERLPVASGAEAGTLTKTPSTPAGFVVGACSSAPRDAETRQQTHNHAHPAGETRRDAHRKSSIQRSTDVHEVTARAYGISLEFSRSRVYKAPAWPGHPARVRPAADSGPVLFQPVQHGQDARATFRVKSCPVAYNIRMPRLRRFLFTANVALSLLMCVASAGLWVRSYRVSDHFYQEPMAGRWFGRQRIGLVVPRRPWGGGGRASVATGRSTTRCDRQLQESGRPSGVFLEAGPFRSNCGSRMSAMESFGDMAFATNSIPCRRLSPPMA